MVKSSFSKIEHLHVWLLIEDPSCVTTALRIESGQFYNMNEVAIVNHFN